jgi:hypothetical protein
MALSRRSFLKNTSAASAAAALSTGLVNSVFGASAPVLSQGPGNKWPGRVVINFNKAAATLTPAGVGTTDTATVKTMVDESIMKLTDQTTVGAAWKAVFPASLSATSKIAIKIPLGCADQTVAPHWSLVQAITEGLQLMDFSGTKFPAANITIYDMNCSNKLSTYGYSTGTAGHFPNVKIVFDSYGSGYTDGARNLQYAKSLNAANFLINVFRPGGHSYFGAGFTLGFKNHYGTYAPDHGIQATQTPPSEYLRDINCTGVVFNKNVLSVCAGIFGAEENSGTPSSQAINYYKYAKGIDSTITATTVPPTTIIMSTDPVTAEMQTIKMMRLNQTTPKITSADMPKYLKASGGITGVLSDVTCNIGIIEESKMDIRIIKNGVSTSGIKEHSISQSNHSAEISASQINGQGTFIEFTLPEKNAGGNASIEVRTIKGALIWKSSQKVMGSVNHFVWNQRDVSNNIVRPGVYVVRVVAGPTSLTTRFSIAR